ncbi:hypothetical protein OKW45_007219 [Paraburkholderia sp. WSM4175]|uniref:hypothetical protein n=1 Tax=Paraburkholderia sp. WSM4175 TaxID=2991072 RepID=UPI003D25F15A
MLCLILLRWTISVSTLGSLFIARDGELGCRVMVRAEDVLLWRSGPIRKDGSIQTRPMMYLGIEVDDALAISEQTKIRRDRRWPHDAMLVAIRGAGWWRSSLQAKPGQERPTLPLALGRLGGDNDYVRCTDIHLGR